jgi:hypothetical protein
MNTETATTKSTTPTTIRLKFCNPYFLDVMTRVQNFPPHVAQVLTETGTAKFTLIGVAIARVLFDDAVNSGWTTVTPYRYQARATARGFSKVFGFPETWENENAKPEKPVKVAKVPKVKVEKPVKVAKVKIPVDLLFAASGIKESTEVKVAETVSQVLSDAVDSVFESEPESVLETEVDTGPTREAIAEDIAQENFDRAVIGSEQKTTITHEKSEDFEMTYRGTRADGSKVPYRAKFTDGTVEYYDAAGRLHDPQSGRAAVTHPDKTTENYRHGVLVTAGQLLLTGSITTRDREG